MSVEVFKPKGGDWVYIPSEGATPESCDSCSFMATYLGVYTEHEVVIKLPTSNFDNHFYYITCKSFRMVKVELAILEEDGWGTFTPINRFIIP